MAASTGYQWRRDKDGLGVWEHRGKVAVAGFGHSPVDRRWDEVSMDKTLGAYSILACQKAMDEAGVTADQIDGVICCDSHIAGGSGSFAPPISWTGLYIGLHEIVAFEQQRFIARGRQRIGKAVAIVEPRRMPAPAKTPPGAARQIGLLGVHRKDFDVRAVQPQV